MKKYKFNISTVITFAILSITLFSCSLRNIKGSGNVSSEVRSLSGFSKVDVSEGLTVIYTPSDEYKVEVIADDNLIKYITTDVTGSELIIQIKGQRSFRKVTKTEIHISAPTITDIKCSGASTFKGSEKFNPNIFTARLSGASEAIVDIDTKILSGDLSGASTLKVSGTATTSLFEGSGASVFSAKEMTTSDLTVNFSGASYGVVIVENSISGSLSGASELFYYGNPTTNVNLSGDSKTTKQ